MSARDLKETFPADGHGHVDAKKSNGRGLDRRIGRLDDRRGRKSFDHSNATNIRGIEIDRLGQRRKHPRVHTRDDAFLNERFRRRIGPSGHACLDVGEIAANDHDELPRANRPRKQQSHLRHFQHGIFHGIRPGNACGFDKANRAQFHLVVFRVILIS